MAEPTQFSFDLREVTEALVRKQGLKEGQWAVSFEFNLGAGVLGQTPADVRPGAFLLISRIQLTKPGPNDPSLAWAVDAEELAGNP